MKLNAFEFALMNNPVRAYLQRTLETPLIIGPSGSLRGLRVLEVGCGRGVGVEILLERLGAAHAVAFDLDPRMVELAQARTARFGGRAHVFVGDAENTALPDASFDAVVEFGILHHVPDWRRALAEIVRVLKPGGTFYFEDILAGLTGAPLLLNLLDHPRVSQFRGAEFRGALGEVGLRLDEGWRRLGEVALIGRARRVGDGELPIAGSSVPGLPEQVHSWYGLNGEVRADGGDTCDVAVEGRKLPHPSLVNLFLRQALPEDTRLQLGAWHEAGHLETLPLAGLVGLALAASSARRPHRLVPRLLASLVGTVAGWELASEAYVVARVGWSTYRQAYASAHSRLALFWLGGLASVFSAWRVSRRG